MFSRMVLAIVALALSTAVCGATDEPRKQGCPTDDLEVIENLIRQAPSCQGAVTLFEKCEFGTSGDVSPGATVTEKCEGDFISKLSAAQRRAYDRKQQRCELKYRDRVGTMYRSFEAFCQAYVARDYSARFLKAAPKRK
jgi:hypothetical protein